MLAFVCDEVQPATKAPLASDPRQIAKRAQEYLRSTGIADAAHVGASPDFFICESAQTPAGHAPRQNAAACHDAAAQAVLELAAWDVEVEAARLGTASKPACITLRPVPLLRAADDTMALKYVVKNVAARAGHLATFMPYLRHAEDGAGMPCTQSLWKDGRPLFFDAHGYAECSQTMLHYIGGVLTHAAALLAFTAPSTNSYRRLTSLRGGAYGAGFSARAGSAAVGLPGAAGEAAAKRFEFRPVDATANPYLAFSALLLAGIDGIRNKIDPIRAGFGPLERDASDVRPLPATLRDALAALAADRGFLTEGGVFSNAFIDEWIDHEFRTQIRPIEMRPHPFEFDLSLDC